jgi:predicted small secreted protein
MDKNKSIIFVVLILIALLAYVFSYLSSCNTKEGFVGVDAPEKKMASLVKPEGISTIPNTMPGAVTNNPTEALASSKDIIALLDAMNTYNKLYEKFLINIAKDSRYSLLHTNSVAYSIKLQAQIETGKIVDKAYFVTSELQRYRDAVRNINSKSEQYETENAEKALNLTKNIIKDKGPVKLADIDHAISRAKQEKKRIDDIRSESSDFKQRSLILEKVSLDLQEIHDKIIKKDMKEQDIPINKSDLKSFLTDIENPTSHITPLPKMQPAEVIKKAKICKKFFKMADEMETDPEIENMKEIAKNFKDSPEDKKIVESLSYLDKSVEHFTNYPHIEDDCSDGKKKPVTKKIKPVPINMNQNPINNDLINNLSKATRDLNWEMQIGVGYDPNVTIQRKFSEKLDAITNAIDSGKLHGAKLQAKIMELQILKQQIDSFNSRRTNTVAEPVNKSGSYASTDASTHRLIPKKYAPDIESTAVRGPMYKVQQELLTSIENPLASNDYTRPGMSTDGIAHRAAKPEISVGGADYKKYASHLCSQIRDAELGDPKEFGCIANPDTDVGPNYSWKGNYKMVCTRLGNTWGDWYPEMFGCPKLDASRTQMPKMNKGCTSSPAPPPEHPPMPKCA